MKFKRLASAALALCLPAAPVLAAPLGFSCETAAKASLPSGLCAELEAYLSHEMVNEIAQLEARGATRLTYHLEGAGAAFARGHLSLEMQDNLLISGETLEITVMDQDLSRTNLQRYAAHLFTEFRSRLEAAFPP